MLHPYPAWQLLKCKQVYLSKFPRLREWIADAHSMTARLEQLNGNREIEVEIVQQGWAYPNLSEATLLGLPPLRLALIREVILLSTEGEAWMFARSVFPSSSLTGVNKRLISELDERPLGKLLFRDPNLRRSPFEAALLSPFHWDHQHCSQHLSNKIGEESLWARRSIFSLANKPILVSEIFLPALSQRINYEV